MRDRTLEDWHDALGVTAAKAKSRYSLPVMWWWQDDRFHVQRGTRGQAVIGGCRQCSKPLYPDFARAVFGDSEHDSRRPVSRPPSLAADNEGPPVHRAWPPPSAPMRADAGNPPTGRRTLRVTRRAAGCGVVKAAMRRGRRSGGRSSRRRPWCAISQHSPRPATRSTAGKPWIPQGPALVTLLAPPSAWIAAWPSIPDVHAVQLIPLDSEGRPRMNDGAKIAQANTRSVRRLLRRRG